MQSRYDESLQSLYNKQQKEYLFIRLNQFFFEHTFCSSANSIALFQFNKQINEIK